MVVAASLFPAVVQSSGNLSRKAALLLLITVMKTGFTLAALQRMVHSPLVILVQSPVLAITFPVFITKYPAPSLELGHPRQTRPAHQFVHPLTR